MIRDVNQLEPDFRGKILQLLNELHKRKIKYVISETRRTRATQTAYFAQGRCPLIEVNALRKAAGLWEISEKENEKIVTWTMNSKHLTGEAIDITPSKDGKNYWWNAPKKEWEKIAIVAKELGLTSGYYWKNQDSPHIQKS